MAWVRIHDGAMSNLKIVSLSDSAFRLWVRGLCYCQTALTDGIIPSAALRTFGAKKADISALNTVSIPGRFPLWEVHDMGFKVHDYLAWNDCRDKVLQRQAEAHDRKIAFEERKAAAKAERKAVAADAARTRSEHVGEPVQNTSTRAREPNQTKPNQTKEEQIQEREKEPSLPSRPALAFVAAPAVGRASASATTEEAIALRGGHLVERYGELFYQHRYGARHCPRPNLDWHEAMSLCRIWDDARLEQLAEIVLTTNDEWISGTDRSFKIFALKATWADARLAAVEAKQRGQA